jgi:hypothetical protein
MDESQHTSSRVAMPSFFEEFRLYHRKDGCVVKVGDDLISATIWNYGIAQRDARKGLRLAQGDRT